MTRKSTMRRLRRPHHPPGPPSPRGRPGGGGVGAPRPREERKDGGRGAAFRGGGGGAPIDPDRDVGAPRQNGRELAGWCGFPATDRVLVSTAISELARNIVRYATSGEIILRLVDDGGKRGVEVLAADTGPGILDVTLAMRDGFSTSRSLGLGLPGVRRIMDEFEISSEWGRGTTVTTRKWMWAGRGPLDCRGWLRRVGQAWATGISRISA